jgi:D-alanine transaminase
MSAAQSIAWINGRFCPLDEAVVSIEDRGFQFADGVYEVIVSYGGRPFRPADHLDRLQKSLDGIGIRFDVASSDLNSIIEQGIRRVGVQEMLVYLQITRGTMPRDHVAAADLKPTILATFKPRAPRDPKRFDQGVSLTAVEDFRWRRCHLKSIALLPNVLARHEAIAAGFEDVLFIGQDGDVREASAANVFAFLEGELVTPPLSPAILSGVTRRYVLECASRIGLKSVERSVSLQQLTLASEVFLCSTTSEVLPVRRIDGHQLATCGSDPFPQTRGLYQEFRRGITSTNEDSIIERASMS